MGRSLYEMYINNPGNYICFGAGGNGKTTQLINIVNTMLHIQNNVRNGIIFVPIYIRLKDLNIMDVGPRVLYDIVSDYFSSSIKKDKVKAINTMFESTSEEYRYVFLLDGFNEIKDYITLNGEGQSVYNCLLNDIKQMNKHENVDFIITLRNPNIIDFDIVFEKYQLIEIGGLSKQQIDEYLGTNIFEMEAHLREVLTIPMMIRVFGEIYKKNPEQAIRLNTKYDLLNEWILLDTISKKNEYRDIDDNYREKAFQEVLPLLAFKTQLQLFKDSQYEGMADQNSLLDDVFQCLNIRGGEKKQIVKAVQRMTILVEKNYTFTHDLLREYLATYCLINNSNILSNNEVKLVFDKLTYYLDENKHKLAVNTVYLDFAELIYGAIQKEKNDNKLVDFLQKNGLDKEAATFMAFDFYHRIAGVYELLNDKKMAYYVGWKAIDLFERVEDRFTEFEKAQKYNFLYYCVNSFKDENIKDPLYLLEKAKEILDGIVEEERPNEYKRVYSMILANMGAYYISPYVKDPEKAKDWHTKCLEYRKRNGLHDAIAGAYGTLMTDCYYFAREGNIKYFRFAYYYYCAVIKRIAGDRRLSNIVDKSAIKAELVVRALGNETNILFSDKSPQWLKDEIIEEIPVQLDHIYITATAGRRHNFSVLKDLYDRVNELMNWDKIHTCPEMEMKLNEYLDKKI